MTSRAEDEGFHEIQLNGKQLVFLFMVATVVSVVIFLCGVFVGRGVTPNRGASAGLDLTGAIEDTRPQVAAQAAAPLTADVDPTEAAPPDTAPPDTAPPPSTEELSYFKRLEQSTPPPGQARSEAAAAGEGGAPADASAGVGVEPPGGGYALQVAALSARNEAEAVARRLAAKGYSAYVLAPARGTPPVFRVRIGKFETRREAETMAAKLQREEQFKPWITR